MDSQGPGSDPSHSAPAGHDSFKTGPRRIAFLLPNIGGGGAERVALYLIRYIRAAGHEVDLVLAQATGGLLPTVPEDVDVVDLAADRLRSVVAPLGAYLHERQPDALHIMMWPLTVVGIIACRLARSKATIVTSDHSTLGRQYGASLWSRVALRLTTRLVYPMADRVVSVSRESADDLARVSGMDRTKIDVIYNPVSIPSLPVAIPPSIEALWSDGCARILTVGNLTPVKNHAMLIRAFAMVARRRPARLVILGEGPMREELTRIADDEGVADRVIMPGFTLDPWPYYASADVFALSSDYEGFSLAIVEAMSCGLNVVSTDCLSGPRELLNDGEFGVLSGVGDAEGLADGIEKLIAHPIAPETLRTRAEALSGPQTAARHLSILIDGPDKRP